MPTLLDRVGRLNLKRIGARTEIVDAGPAKMHVYRLRGDGERPLVLLHGVGSSAATFPPLVARLRPHFGDILMPEAPGHGFSPAPEAPLDTEAFLDCVTACLDTEIEAPFVLYGNSLGGGMALRYAIARPERVAALAVLSPAGARVDAEALAALVRDFELPTSKDARAFVRRLFHRPP
ncbi:MAG: alpha/beta fold hydrolase, partial [Deltaproteobacteria bacterium]